MSVSEVELTLQRLGGAKEKLRIDLNQKVSDLVLSLATKYEIEPSKIKVLCKGKILKHTMTEKTLSDMKIKANDKLIVTNKPSFKKAPPKDDTSSAAAVPSPQQSGNSATYIEEMKNDPDSEIRRLDRLQEIKKAAEKIADRTNDSFAWRDDYYMEITNQYGEAVPMPENVRQALTVGMTLHSKAQTYMKRREWDDALYLAQFAFESFSQCDSKWLEIIDNYSLCALDIVWLFFLKKDEKHLMEAGNWLKIAETGLQRAHGKNLERLRQIRGGFIPELSLYVRLNLLRAMQCFYSSQTAMANTWLETAERDLRKLQLNDMDLVQMQSMGFSMKESRRALRLCNSNLEQAIQHVFTKRQEIADRLEEERRAARERRRARRYGRTKNGKFVNIEVLDKLKTLDISEEILVEAMRQTDNHYEHTMDLLFNEDKKQQLIETIIDRGMRNDDSSIIEYQNMSFSEARIRAALIMGFDRDTALQLLTQPTTKQNGRLDVLEAELTIRIQARDERDRKRREHEAAQRAYEASLMNTDDTVPQEEQPDVDEDGDNVEMSQPAEDAELPASDMVEDAAMVESAALDGSAFPNPHLGDTAENKEEDAVDIVPDFEDNDPVVDPDDDAAIHEHIIDEFEDDPDAYLDLDLTDESEALQQLKTMLASIQP